MAMHHQLIPLQGRSRALLRLRWEAGAGEWTLSPPLEAGRLYGAGPQGQVFPLDLEDGARGRGALPCPPLGALVYDGKAFPMAGGFAGEAATLERAKTAIRLSALGAEGEVLDPFGGRADLERRLIRCVGDPDRRFAEDALRMFRALRFAAQLGFEIEEDTLAAIRRNARRAENLSGERVKAELEKILLSPRPERAGEALELSLLAHLWPERTCPDLAGLGDLPPEPIPRWRGFCRITGFPITALPVERALRRGVLHPEEEALRRLALSGGELAALGFVGPAIGAAQRRLAAHVLAHPEDNTKEKLLALAERYREG